MPGMDRNIVLGIRLVSGLHTPLDSLCTLVLLLQLLINFLFFLIVTFILFTLFL